VLAVSLRAPSWLPSHPFSLAACSAPPLDIGYLIFAARKRQEDLSGSKGQMSALSRVAFEKHLTDARKNTQKAIQQQVAFWSELGASGAVHISRLHQIAVAMTDAECRAEASFAELLSLNAQSLLVLRLYSEFTLRVRNNAEKASLLVADAERIEEVSCACAPVAGSLMRVLAGGARSNATAVVAAVCWCRRPLRSTPGSRAASSA
jgi:hypothetical protein